MIFHCDGSEAFHEGAFLRRLLIPISLLFLLPLCVFAGDAEDAAAAYKSGNFRKVAELTLKHAEQGNSKAQCGLVCR